MMLVLDTNDLNYYFSRRVVVAQKKDIEVNSELNSKDLRRSLIPT
jgi:hypothetical protein